MNSSIAICMTSIVMLSYLIITLISRIKKAKAYKEELTFKSQRFTIALLVPSAKSIISIFIKAFISYLKKYASFEFETLECITNDDRDRTYKWAEYLADNNVDLIYAVGKSCTDTLYRTMKTRNKHTPIVSCGVPMDFCDTPLEVMQKNIPFTASTCDLDWPTKINLLQEVYPNIKRALILFRSIDEISHRNLKEKNSIAAALRKHHIKWEMHHITNIEKESELTAEILADIDIVIISRSSELMPYASKITDDCAQFNVPVFSTDITCNNIFIGISENTEVAIAERSAQQTMQILEDGKHTSTIPIQKITGMHHLVIHPNKAHPLTATTVVGHALSLSSYVNITLTKKLRSHP